ncbi:MAG: CPBP family intramembrane metalloprotease [Myxococcales bacterium]|nr:CPBP family intramembrane metalloprotease [Myxococcales bacterium]
MSPERRSILVEQVGLWLVTLLLIRGGVSLWEAGVHEAVLALVPVLFMYMPDLALRQRGLDPSAYPLGLPSRHDPVWRQALVLNAVIIGAVALPFIGLYHLWQTEVFGMHYRGTWPSQPLMLIGYHLFFVAIPEEMYYRGFMQSRLDEVWKPRWNILGATLGPGWLVTCVLFAFGHSLVVFQWWHFAIIIPSLAFGWLRAKTGDVIAGAFFHAWCHITVGFLDTLYGVIPP